MENLFFMIFSHSLIHYRLIILLPKLIFKKSSVTIFLEFKFYLCRYTNKCKLTCRTGHYISCSSPEISLNHAYMTQSVADLLNFSYYLVLYFYYPLSNPCKGGLKHEFNVLKAACHFPRVLTAITIIDTNRLLK